METLDNPLWGDDWTEVRDLFDTLQPGHAYLNHGGFGNAPRTVLLTQKQWRARMDANATRFFRRELAPGMATASRAVAEFLGAPAGDTRRAGHQRHRGHDDRRGLGSAGRRGRVPAHRPRLLDHDLGRRAPRAARPGPSVVTAQVPLAADAAEIAEAVLAAVTPRTKVALIDHVTSSTARRFPVEELVPALQERGVIVIVDAAHAPGMLPIDLAALNPDFWGGNLHKWGYAPRSAGAFWAAPKWRSDAAQPDRVLGRGRRSSRANLQEIGTNDRTLAADQRRTASRSCARWARSGCGSTT